MYVFFLEDSRMHVVSPFINESHLPMVLKSETVKILEKKRLVFNFYHLN